VLFRSIRNLESRKIPGVTFRTHNFIPTFNKFSGQLCSGLQIHVTDLKAFRPVATTFELIEAIIQTSPKGLVKFTLPPYEYEYRLMPFDILSGDDLMRKALESGASVNIEKERWRYEIELFKREFSQVSLYQD
jgi:uncharacterized protein YbbC (DUF1343 family)